MVSRLKINSKSNNKSSYINDNITIDAKHNEMINYFNSIQNSIPSLKEELKKMIAEYNNKDQSRKHDIEYILYRDNLREKINELKERINKIICNDDVNKYYLDVGILLHNYYESIEMSKTDNQTENAEDNMINYDDYFDSIGIDENDIDLDDDFEDDKPVVQPKPKKEFKSVLNFFNCPTPTTTTQNISTENKTNNETTETESTNTKNTNNSSAYTSTKISDFVKEESKFKKKDILDEYLKKIDPKYIYRIKYDQNMYKCSKCNIEMTLFPSDGYQICENCGIQQNIFIESDKPSFKDPPMEVCYFTYRRINHWNEFHDRQKNMLNELKYLILII